MLVCVCVCMCVGVYSKLLVFPAANVFVWMLSLVLHLISYYIRRPSVIDCVSSQLFIEFPIRSIRCRIFPLNAFTTAFLWHFDIEHAHNVNQTPSISVFECSFWIQVISTLEAREHMYDMCEVQKIISNNTQAHAAESFGAKRK